MNLIFEWIYFAECRVFCPKHYDPVCGTDGRTYGNSCLITAKNCRTNANIRVVSKGKCGESQPGEKNLLLISQTFCFIDERIKGISFTECGVLETFGRRVFCPMHYDPVCGTDGKTYGNHCEIIAENCRTKANIRVANKGKCGQKGGKLLDFLGALPLPRIWFQFKWQNFPFSLTLILNAYAQNYRS